jgi:hypothetical protein
MNWQEMNQQYDYLTNACNLLKCKPGELSSKIDKLLLKTEEIDSQILDRQAYLDIMEFMGNRRYYYTDYYYVRVVN